MSTLELFILAVGLAMDAVAVSICKGLAMEQTTVKKASIVGGWFGGFQALMPFIGYILGSQFASYVTKIAPWIAFSLLLLIGVNMIKEAISKEEEEENSSLKAGEMFLLAIATSIDALVVGVTFSFLNVNIYIAISFIGAVTFILSAVGVKVGNIFGSLYKSKAEFAGGAILIILGTKILLEGLGILSL